MKKTTKIIIGSLIGFLILILILIGGFFAYKSQNKVQPISTVATSTPMVTIPSNTFDNFEAVQNAFKDYAIARNLYNVKWTNISEFQFGSSTMYIGELHSYFGNGVMSEEIPPVFVLDGIMYYPNGYGGNMFKLSETNWVSRYKRMIINDYGPVQTLLNIDHPYSYEEIQAVKAITGLESLDYDLDPTGKIITVKAKLNNQEYTASSTKNYSDFTLATVSENSNSEDQQTMYNKDRKLAGVVSGTETVTIAHSVKVTYPKTINDLPVAFVKESSNSYLITIGDQENDPDEVRINCSDTQYPDMYGPKNDPYLITKSSQSKLTDWGFKTWYHTDNFNFNSINNSCSVSASGAFRLNMLSISLP